MSEEEKAAQLGRAMLSFRDAKENLGHLDHKVKTVLSAYKDASSVYQGDLQSANGKVRNSNTPVPWAGQLMNESELAALLTERQKAKDQFAEADSVLKSFGVML